MCIEDHERWIVGTWRVRVCLKVGAFSHLKGIGSSLIQYSLLFSSFIPHRLCLDI
jgi:hypothetical protein